MPLEWMDGNKESYPGYIAYHLLITCKMCHGLGQLKMHSYEPHMMLSTICRPTSLSMDMDINIIITMCPECHDIGRKVDMNTWDTFRSVTKNLNLIDQVRMLLNDYLGTNKYGGCLL